MAGYEMQLYTFVDGTCIKKQMEVTTYYSLGVCLKGDDECRDIAEVATLSDLYRIWRAEKTGDESHGEKGKWNYSFFKHVITVETNKVSGKKQFVDTRTQGKVYRRKNKIFFKVL